MCVCVVEWIIWGTFLLQEIMKKADEDDNLELDFKEFSRYMQEHERKLRLAFSDLDKNKDGQYSKNCNS